MIKQLRLPAVLVALAVAAAMGCGDDLSSSGKYTRIQVAPPSAALHVGETQTFQATGVAADGTLTLLASPTVVWSSSDASVASIDPASGVATAVALGSATITATVGQLQG